MEWKSSHPLLEILTMTRQLPAGVERWRERNGEKWREMERNGEKRKRVKGQEG